MNNPGKIIVIGGPSGSGKTTVMKKMLGIFPELGFSISVTTRQVRPGEIHGSDYYFITTEAFNQLLAEGKLLEYQEVYKGFYYGTPLSEISRIQGENKIPILDIDVKGALNVKKMFGSICLTIFIHPGSREVLKQRLIHRKTEDDKSRSKRLDRAVEELEQAVNFDFVVRNDKDLESCLDDTEAIIRKFIQ